LGDHQQEGKGDKKRHRQKHTVSQREGKKQKDMGRHDTLEDGLPLLAKSLYFFFSFPA
jgi:hypothetical protein